MELGNKERIAIEDEFSGTDGSIKLFESPQISFKSPKISTLALDEKPMQIALLICGNWRSTKMPLEYLLLLLNTRQKIFEYQLISLDEYVLELQRVLSKGSVHDRLVTKMLNGGVIDCGKLDMKHYIHEIACALKVEIEKRSDLWDKNQSPDFFIFVTTSKHTDVNFFQDDGSNGFTNDAPCRGAIIMTGHHERKFAPPTVIEFIYKFIFRISCKWKFPDFKRNQRHFGQKACLFDFNHDISYVRYLVLHNYICSHCEAKLGGSVCRQIKSALCMKALYGSEIERHPAKISSDLGFNLSLVKGIYKTEYDRIRETVSESFLSRIGSLLAVSFVMWTFYATDTASFFINED